MKVDPTLQVLFVLLAFLAVLGGFIVLAIIGADGLDTLSDTLKVLTGALAGVVIARTGQTNK